MLNIILYGHLYWYTAAKKEKLELEFKGTGLELLQALNIPASEILVLKVNGENFMLADLLPENCKLEVFPIIAGG
jgi:hypothetical protein